MMFLCSRRLSPGLPSDPSKTNDVMLMMRAQEIACPRRCMSRGHYLLLLLDEELLLLLLPLCSLLLLSADGDLLVLPPPAIPSNPLNLESQGCCAGLDCELIEESKSALLSGRSS